jgi:hypothetical protein
MKTVVAFPAGVLLAGLLPFAYSQSAWDRPEVRHFSPKTSSALVQLKLASQTPPVVP